MLRTRWPATHFTAATGAAAASVVALTRAVLGGGALRCSRAFLAPRDGHASEPPAPAPAKAATAERVALPKACGFTKQDLMGLLKEVDSGSVKYERYFFKNRDATGKGVRFHRTNLDEDIDRCKECGLTVSEHNPAAAVATAPQSPPALLEDLITEYADRTELIFPGFVGPRRRIGRDEFDVLLHNTLTRKIFAFQHGSFTEKQTVALVLQCAAGVGKTFATMTARRGLLHLGLAKDYELITLYVGFSQGFPLTQNEGDHITDSPDLFSAVQDVLYLPIGLILECMLRTMCESNQGLGVLDAAHPDDWVQGMVRFKSNDERLTNKKRCAILAPLVNRMKALHALAAGKKLAILVAVDEAHWLDELRPPDPALKTGGARVALRVLRTLQKNVYDDTQGNVALLPIATGINASVSLAPDTEQGENLVVGQVKGEALVRRDDFKTLFTQCAESARATSTVSLTPWMEEALGVAHYPHVRAMVKSPFRCAMEEKITVTTALLPDPDALVVKAFCGEKMTRSQLPVGLIPTKPSGTSLSEVIPVPSFYSWYCIHNALQMARPQWPLARIPFDTVDENWVVGAVKYPLFEHRCFTILGYFLSVFGPIGGGLRSTFLEHLRAPLKEWFPQAPFVVKQSVTLGHDMEHHNPTSAPAGTARCRNQA